MSVVSDVVADARGEALARPPQQSSAVATLPCVYCRAGISADDFVFWTTARRLVSATCPQCTRRVTFAAHTWRRWTRQAQA